MNHHWCRQRLRKQLFPRDFLQLFRACFLAEGTQQPGGGDNVVSIAPEGTGPVLALSRLTSWPWLISVPYISFFLLWDEHVFTTWQQMACGSWQPPVFTLPGLRSVSSPSWSKKVWLVPSLIHSWRAWVKAEGFLDTASRHNDFNSAAL